MQKISTGLENAFVNTGWSWKSHKSKERIFLHQNYTPQKFSTPKKNQKLSIEKKVDKKIRKSNQKSKISD